MTHSPLFLLIDKINIKRSIKKYICFKLKFFKNILTYLFNRFLKNIFYVRNREKKVYGRNNFVVAVNNKRVKLIMSQDSMYKVHNVK
jgi:hypothetical protein